MKTRILRFFKKYWLGVIFLIFIVAVSIFGHFYDLQLMIVKKRNIPTTASLVTPPGIEEAVQPEAENQKIPKINLETLDVDLENLSEDEISAVLAYLRFRKIKTALIPSGVPEIYGQELDISFDRVQDAINKVRVFGPTYGQEGKKIILTGSDLERYIKIGLQTACQYCCPVRTLVREDGTAACGCAHSIMMRALAAYLIKNHPELSDEQILEELNKWKATFFPKQTLTETLAVMEKAGKPGTKEILEEFPEFLPQMVGGC